MINTYTDQVNPCGFCVDTKTVADIEKKEHLEFILSGTDTKLFVRETSEPCSRSTSIAAKEEVHEYPEETVTTFTVPSAFPENNSRRTEKTPDKSDDKNYEKHTRNKELCYLYNKKWSGKTYFEEELRKLRLKEYEKEVLEATKKRHLWKEFQRELARDRRRNLVRSSGPEWWQEPSQKQIRLALCLGEVIKADHEEEVTGRTRQWLLDLGVTVRLTPKQIRSCMRRSFLDAVDFLLEVHTVILKTQLHVKKKRGDLERPFSINERILLSAVCVLQLPTLLTMLHYILPPPAPFSEPKHIQKLMFGDLCDERIRYSTPYMEPLPFRDQKNFNDWAFRKVYRALLPTILLDAREDSNGRLILNSTSLSTASLSKHNADKGIITKRYSDLSVSPSVCWLLSQCASKRIITDSLHTCIDEESVKNPRFFSRRLTRKSILLNKQLRDSLIRDDDLFTDKEEDSNKGQVFVRAESKYTQDTTLTTPHQYNTSSSKRRQSHGQGSPLNRQGSAPESQVGFSMSHISIYDRFGTEQFFDGLESVPRTQYKKDDFHSPETSGDRLLRIKSKENNNKSYEEVNGSNELGNTISRVKSEEKSVSGKQSLSKIWDEIRALPKKKRLPHALKILADMGDPLAQLPRIHKIPNVQRWLELRDGRNKVLSKGFKDELLRNSKGMWKIAPVGFATQPPKAHISKREERKLTWDRKKWLESKAKKAMETYNTRIKQEKVDNARAYYQTMLNHYDHGSDLNRRFREVFYTYLPAREADTFVYKPWQP